MKATKLKMLVLAAGWLFVVGCVAPHRSQSWNSWTQTASNAEQERISNDSPQDMWNTLP